MDKQQNIINKLARVSIPEDAKSQWKDLLGTVGVFGLGFLEDQISAVEFRLVSKVLLEICKQAMSATQALRQGQEGPWISLLEDFENSARVDYGRYLLPFALDAKKFIAPGNFKRLNSRIIDLQVYYLDALTPQVMLDAIRNDLDLWLHKVPDMAEYVKYFYFERVPKPDGGWSANMLKTLIASKLPITSKPLVLENVQLPPTAENWIKDYIAFSARAANQRGTLELVNYLSSSKNIVGLNAEEKEAVESLLKLYAWLQNPVVRYQETRALWQMYRNLHEYGGEFNKPSAQPVVVEELVGMSPQPEPRIRPDLARPIPQPLPVAPKPLLKTPPLPKPAPKIPAAPARVEFAEADPYKTGLRLSGHGSAPVSMDTIKAGMEKKKQEEIERQKRQEQRINQKLDELKKKVKN